MALCILALTGRAPGQGLDAASILYSHGVHAYFDGDASEAERSFTRAISISPNDPRAYYYRGLSRLRLGRDADAQADLRAGAAAEARQPNRYATGAALQRVQGRQRLLLEKYRQQAREEYALQREEVSRARYEQITSREADVMRHPVAVPLERLVPPGEAKSLLGVRPAAGPSAAPAASVAPPATASSTATEAAGDPFADDTTPPQLAPAAPQAEGPPADDLFGTPAQESDDSHVGTGDSPERAAAPPDSTPPADSEPNPFLDEENPFGP
jgi:hypothetical protein